MRLLFVFLFLGIINASPIVVYVGWNAGGDIAGGIREAVDAGFNVINLEFWMSNGPADTVAAWAALPVATKQATLDYAHSKGAVVIMSVGGGTDHIDSVMTQYTGQNYGTRAAQFAKTNLFDGVDLDLEFSPGTNGPLVDGSGVNWIVECHKAVRAVIGSSAYLTHAPQAPYLGTWAGPNRGYVQVYKLLNGDIDWFNLQFYNQGQGCYSTYDTLFKSYSSGWDSGNAIAELKAQGIPYEKLVVGKYYPASNGGSGIVEPSVLNTFFQKAKSELGWTGGFMVWGYKCNNGMSAAELQTWGKLMQGTFGNSLPKKGSGISTGTGTGSGTGTGVVVPTGTGTGSGSSGPVGTTTTRCGSTWTTANSACGSNCKSDADCLSFGTKCWADLSVVPCQNVQTATSTGTGTGKLTATSTGTGTGKLTATATSTGTGTGKLTATATSTGTGTGKLTSTATSTGTGTGKLTATATSTGTGTGKLTSTGTGTGSSTATNFRCGPSWTIADSTCGTNCKTNDDCLNGQTCYAYVSMTPCQGRMIENDVKNDNEVHIGHQTLAFIAGSVVGVVVMVLGIAVVLAIKPKTNASNYVQM